MIQAETGQILFLYPQDPAQSFTFPYSKDDQDSLSLGDFFKLVNEKKSQYMEFSDSFGRTIPKSKTIQEFLDLQPFYIVRILPKVLTLAIKMPSGKETFYFNLGITESIEPIYEFVEKAKGIPIALQRYSLDGKRLFKESRLLDENIQKPEIELQLTLKPQHKGSMQIFFRYFSEKRIVIHVDIDESISDVKAKVQDKIGIPVQKMMFCGRLLVDKKLVCEYNIQKDDTIDLVQMVRGGGVPGGFKFADITQTSKAKNLKWSTSAPDWRMVHRNGLSVEGQCTNASCKAYKQWVIISKGIGTYDIIYDQHNNNCPMCSSYVKVEKCAFNNCVYGYTGIMLQDNGQPPKKVTSKEEVKVGDNYMLFDPETVGQASWLSLKIITKDTLEPTGVECRICKRPVKLGKKTLRCEHVFHDECLQKVKGLNIRCVICHF